MREPRATGPAGLGLSRGYRRLPAVEAEIGALPAVSDAAFRPAAERAEALETIVFALRRLKRAGDEAAALALAEVLVERAAPLVARAARSQFPAAPADREDALQMTALQLWREVLDTSPKEEFWEVYFARMVTRACSDAADALRRARERERPYHRGEGEDGDLWDEEANLSDLTPIDTDLLVTEALAQLDGDVRRAVWLSLNGCKARSNDPRELTIAAILGVSDRTVRTYLRSGEATIRSWLARGSAGQQEGDHR